MTLVTFSLILGLIYFWCPGCCRCCPARCGCLAYRAGSADLETTKVLTVRDGRGRVISQAATVEVWKTRQNKIRTLEVLETPQVTEGRSRSPSPADSPGLATQRSQPGLKAQHTTHLA